MGKVRSKEEWQRIVIEQNSSGKSVCAYCELFGISTKAFYRWRKYFDRTKEAAKFIEIKEEKSEVYKLEISFPNGILLKLGY
jgi:transposase-like protein